MGLERVIVAISLAVGDMHRGPTTVDVTLYFRGNADQKRPLKVRTTSPMICAFIHSKQTFFGGRSPPVAGMYCTYLHVIRSGQHCSSLTTSWLTNLSILGIVL